MENRHLLTTSASLMPRQWQLPPPKLSFRQCVGYIIRMAFKVLKFAGRVALIAGIAVMLVWVSMP